MWNTLLLRVLISIKQVIRHTFFKTGFVIYNKPPLKKTETVTHGKITLLPRFAEEYIFANGGVDLD